MRYKVMRDMDVLKAGFATFLEAVIWAKRNTNGVRVWFLQE